MTLDAVAVFCGSSHGARPAYTEAARTVGRLVAERGARLVYGGGGVGLMAEVAAAALAAGGEVIGVIPDHLEAAEVGEVPGVRTEVVRTMHERKARMHALADGVVCLPGGFGTLDEAFEALTWTQLGLHDLGIGLLDVDGYWNDLVSFTDHAVSEGFLKPQHRANLLLDADAASLLDRLEAFAPSRSDKWS
jgi:uncharacterized protein (TIGR00730 family)